jgi:hypothetical protein
MIRLNRAGLPGLALLVACGGAPAENTNPPGTAEVRLMNAVAGSPALDLVVGGKVIVGGVPYERASALASVPGGAQTVTLRRSGESTVLSTSQLSFTVGARYNVVASGTGTALLLTPSVVVDTGLAKPDRANLRIINVATPLPPDSAAWPAPVPLNVVITAPGVPLPGAPSQLSLDARASSYSTLIYFDPATYVVRFVRPGTGEVIAETPSIVIGAGQVRAVTLQRRADGTYQTSVVSE